MTAEVEPAAAEWQRPALPDPQERRDVLARLRSLEGLDPDKRTGAVAEAVQEMLENGMDLVAIAEVREYLKAKRLLPVALFEEMRRNVRRAAGRRVTSTSPATPERPDADLQIWPSWASDQDILKKLIIDLKSKCALTGERRNAKLTYLALQSRRRRKPVSIVIKGQSASGKSYTVQCVLLAVQPRSVMVRTGLSELALVYSKESFAHRTIVIFEAVALKESREKNEGHQGAMILRTLLSEGVIRHETTVKNENGEFETAVYEKEGPTNCILTTTADSLHHENETRMLTLSTDDSKEQTRRVMIAAAMAEDLNEAEPDFSEWHELDAALDAAVHEVTVPYRAWLSRSIPAAAVRLRRDFPTLLELIRTHAMIHQLQRETDDRGWIIATEADYVAVRDLVTDVISDQVGVTVPPKVRETVQAVERITTASGVTVAELATELKLDPATAYRRAKAAEKRGHLANIEPDSGRGKKPARYVVASALPEDVVMLPDLPAVEVWSACTFDELADYFEDDEAAGQSDDNGKSANMHDAAGVKPERSQSGGALQVSDAGQGASVALLQEQAAARLIEINQPTNGHHFATGCPDCGDPDDSEFHAANCPGRDPAA